MQTSNISLKAILTAFFLVTGLTFSLSAPLFPLAPPQTPTEFRIDTLYSTSTSLLLRWTDNANNETGFRIFRATFPSLVFTQVGTANANAVQYTDNNLTPNQTYVYYIEAFNSSETSVPSSYAAGVTRTSLIKPYQVLARYTGANSVRISWKDTSIYRTYFEVYRGTSRTSLSYYTFSNDTFTVDNSAFSGNSYYYAVRTYFTNGFSSNYSPFSDTVEVSNPSGVTATAFSSTAIDLVWGAITNANATGIEIYFTLSPSIGFFLLTDTVNKNATAFRHTALQPNTTYYYRIRTILSGGQFSDFSFTVNATTLKVTPTAPSNLQVSGTTSTSISLAWNDNSSTEDNFVIERSTDGTNFFFYTNISANQTTYTDVSVNNNTRYWYRVYATNNGGNSTFSNVVDTITGIGQPTSLYAVSSFSDSSVTLYWTDNSANEVGYRVERATNSSFTQNLVVLDTNLTYSSVGIINLANLLPNTTYYYRVAARGTGSILSSYSNTATVRMMRASTNLTVTSVGVNNVSLSWTNNTTAGQSDGQIIEYSTDSVNFSTIQLVGTTATSALISSGLSANTKYYFRVYSYSSNGSTYIKSKQSNIVSATTLTVLPPTKPLNFLVSSITQKRANFSWTDASNETGYTLYYATSQFGSYSTAAFLSANTTSTQITFLSPNTTYYFTIAAVNSGGSSYSDTISLTTLPIPTGPTALTVLGVGQDSIRLRWNRDSSVANILGYYIYRSTSQFGSYSFITSTTDTTYRDTNLNSGRIYFYYVRSYTSDFSTSTNSTGIGDTTFPPARPTNVDVNNPTITTIRVTWTDNAINEQGVRIYYTTNRNFINPDSITINGSSLTQYTLTGLQPATMYYVRLRALGFIINSDTIGTTDSLSTLPKPYKPKNVTADQIQQNSFRLNWTDSVGENGYRIRVATSFANLTSVSPIDVAANSTNRILTTHSFGSALEAGTRYFVSITSYVNSPSFVEGDTTVISVVTLAPSAPSFVRADSISATQINVSWERSLSTDRIRIHRSTNRNFTGSDSIFLGTVNSYSHTGLTPDTWYYYRVRAIGGELASPFSVIDSAKTFPAPSPIIFTEIATLSQNSVRVRWQRQIGVSSYEIRIATDSANLPFTSSVFNTSASDTIRTFTSLTAGSLYFIAVRAVSGTSVGAWTTVRDTTLAPNIPTSVSAVTQTANSIRINYSHNVTVNSTTIYIARNDIFTVGLDSIITFNTTNYTFAGLNAGTTYFFRVRANGSILRSEFSQTVNATTFNPLVKVTGLTATPISESQINLDWTDVNTEETGYRVEYSFNNINFFNFNTTEANATSFQVTGLTANTRYYFRVYAFRTNPNATIDNATFSDTATAVTFPPLANPTTFTATAIAENQINLSWSAVASVDSFEIGYSTNFTYNTVVFASGSATNISVTGLNPNTTYNFRIRSRRGTNSSSGAFASATTPNIPAPTNFVATPIAENKIRLTWNSVSNATGYRVAGAVSTIVVTDTFYEATLSNAGTNYEFSVATVRTTGTSSNIFTSAQTLPPLAPSDLVITNATASAITVSWVDNSQAEVGYVVEYDSNSNFSTAQTSGILNPNTTTYTTPSLSCTAGTYYFRVRANGGVSHSAYTSTLQANLNTPTAPTNLIITNVLANSATITWDFAESEHTGFILTRASNRDLTASVVTFSINAASRSYTLLNLTPETDYFVALRANYSSCPSVNTPVDSLRTLVPVVAPTNLQLTVISESRINATWQDNSTDETGFELQVSNNATFATYRTINTISNSASISALNPSTTYYVRVRARRLTDTSAFTSVVSAATLPAVAPGIPQNLTATTLSATQVRLTWQRTAPLTETTFKLERATSEDFTQNLTIFNISSGVTQFDNTGLTPSTTYFYRIKSATQFVESGYSNVASAVTSSIRAPEQLSATVISPNEIRLSWADRSDNETRFEMERRSSQTDDFIKVADINANTQVFNNTNLADGTFYQYRVRAVNASDRSAYSNIASQITPMNAPSNLTATSNSAGSLSLTWRDNSQSETGYLIEYALNSNFTGAQQINMTQKGESYTLTGLQEFQTYFVRIRAYNSLLTTSNSNTATATTLLGVAPQPTNIIAVSGGDGSTQINLAWQWSGNPSAGTNFIIRRRKVGTTDFVNIDTVNSLLGNQYQDGGLLPDTEFEYCIVASNPLTPAPATCVLNSSPARSSVPTSPPAAPSDLVAQASGKQDNAGIEIEVSWKDNSDNEDNFILEYAVTTDTGTVFPNTPVSSITLGANTTRYTLTNLKEDQKYVFRVRAQNSYRGNGSNGSSAFAPADFALTRPAPVENLEAKAAGQTQMELSWTSVGRYVEGFLIQRSLDANKIDSTIKVIAVDSLDKFRTSPNSDKIVLVDEGLQNNTQYFYKVIPYNFGGDTVPKAPTYQELLKKIEELSVRPIKNPTDGDKTRNIPARPLNLTAAPVSASAALLAWTDNSDNEDKFMIEAKDPLSRTNANFTQIDTVGANVTNYTYPRLMPNRDYVFRVRASNLYGESSYSNEATLKTPKDLSITPPNPPAGLTAEPASDTEIVLNWSDNSNNEYGFLIERKEEPNGLFVQIGEVADGITTFNDTKVSLNKRYCYRVRATNGGGESTYSNEACAESSCDALRVDIRVDTDTACQYKSVLMTATTNTARANYIWKLNGTSIIGAANSPIFTARQAGAYTVEIIPNAGRSTCNKTSTPVNIVIKQPLSVTLSKPVTSDTITAVVTEIAPNGTVVPVTDVKYQWYKVSGSVTTGSNSAFAPISGATSSRYVVPSKGFYFVEVTKGKCSFTSAPLEQLINGFEDENGNSTLQLYPNPVSTSLVLSWHSSQYGNYQISIITLDGKPLYSMKGYKSNFAEQVSLDVSELSTGLYLLHITMGDNSKTLKFSKQ